MHQACSFLSYKINSSVVDRQLIALLQDCSGLFPFAPKHSIFRSNRTAEFWRNDLCIGFIQHFSGFANASSRNSHQHSPSLSPETTRYAIFPCQLHLFPCCKSAIAQCPRHERKEYTILLHISKGNSSDPHARLQSFNGLILREDRNRRSKIKRLFCGSANRDRNEIRYSAEELLENMPPAFIRFPSFSIGFPDESIFQFFEQAKQHFVNSRICLEVSYSDGDEYLHRKQKLLTDIFLDAAEIFIYNANVAPETLFKTNGVRNCDKVSMWFLYNSSFPGVPPTRQSTEAVIEWLEWKQHEPGSRRHLVIYRYDRSLELLEALIQAFKSATKPLNYAVTFICRMPHQRPNDQFVKDLAPLELENDSTGERLSFFHHQMDAYRLRRRIVNDSEKNNDQRDKSFYNYRHPEFESSLL
ncbi:hypothetical protein Ddc_12344 [Ditylenchus destructor]|nr:hypothetical protein Ddc_12344 [Ditylenchus destructor]